MGQNPLGVVYGRGPTSALQPLNVDANGNIQTDGQPSSLPGAGVGAIVNSTTAAAAGLVGKSVGGNMYDGKVVNIDTVGGYLMLLDSASIPATGTLAAGVIVDFVNVGPASINGGYAALGPYSPPQSFANGATLVFSTTAPPVMTTVAGAGFFRSRTK